ncbi:hypothetical protein E2542_SST27965 [Spatholobus suberectus]|nr:hypothetical protein E2542_SST27965 [Spatholobus suberectus]
MHTPGKDSYHPIQAATSMLSLTTMSFIVLNFVPLMMEYLTENRAKKKAYTHLKEIARLQGKRLPPNPYLSPIKEIQVKGGNMFPIVSSIPRKWKL